jgi:hypothetical protein
MPTQATAESPFQLTLKGVAAGLVGTLVMTSALQAASYLLASSTPESTDEAEELATLEALSALDVSQPSPSTPTEQVAERLVSRVFNHELSQGNRQRLGLGIYWAYGALWGALSAQVQLRLRPPALPYGIVLGVVAWLIGPGRIVPALRLYQRPPSPGIARRLLAVSLHILYGLTTALTLDRISAPR